MDDECRTHDRRKEHGASRGVARAGGRDRCDRRVRAARRPELAHAADRARGPGRRGGGGLGVGHAARLGSSRTAIRDSTGPARQGRTRSPKQRSPKTRRDRSPEHGDRASSYLRGGRATHARQEKPRVAPLRRTSPTCRSRGATPQTERSPEARLRVTTRRCVGTSGEFLDGNSRASPKHAPQRASSRQKEPREAATWVLPSGPGGPTTHCGPSSLAYTTAARDTLLFGRGAGGLGDALPGRPQLPGASCGLAAEGDQVVRDPLRRVVQDP